MTDTAVSADTLDTQPKARWADIEIETVQPGYRVSDLGEVMSPTGRVLDGSVYRSKGGFHDSRQVALLRVPGCGFSGALQMRVADLVARYFLEAQPDPAHEIEYINGDFMDCRAVNLRWGQRRPRPVSRPTRTPSRSAKSVLARRVLNNDPHWRLVQTAKVHANRYWVSDLGEVRGTRNVNLTRLPYLNGGVGVNVKSSATGMATTVPVAQLVLDAFVGVRPTAKHRPRHRNGDLTDCRVENLYWGIPGRDEEDPTPTPVPTPSNPTPVPAAVDTDEVEVTILARYSYGGVSILVNDDEILEQPTGTPENASALSKIWARYAADRK